MGLGSSSRMSRKGDLITMINMERSHQGVPYAEVAGQSFKLWKLKIAELERVYKDLLSQRK